jgi:hypothetical protein
LEVAARLKNLDVPTLVVEQNERIGDNVTLLCHLSPSSYLIVTIPTSGEIDTNRSVSMTLFVRFVDLRLDMNRRLTTAFRVQHDANHAVRRDWGIYHFVD